MRKIFILGAGVYQAPLIRAARQMGLYTIVASIPGDYPGFALADRVCRINTTDREGILRAARQEGVDGICTSGTDVAVASIGYVCDHMGLPGLSGEAALQATDKARMKEAFRRGGVSTAAFRKVYDLKGAQAAAEELGYPVVIKRVDSSGSRGITIAAEPSGLEAAFREAVRQTAKPYVLVEEKLNGTEIGVDGVVQGGKLVFLAPHEKLVFRTANTVIPAGHAFPYRGTARIREEIAEQIRRAVSALGLDNCPVNADVFVDGDRVSVVEIGGRTGATCIPELISLYYGFDFYEKILQNALGVPLDFTPQRPARPCMARLLMSPASGILTAVDEEGLEAIRREGIAVALDYPAGHPVEAMKDGTTRIGHVILQTEHTENLEAAIRRVQDCIRIDGVSLEKLWERRERADAEWKRSFRD